MKKNFYLGRKELQLFFKQKSVGFRGKFVSMRVQRKKDAKTQFAIIISSKIHKNAVARNKTRRRIKEIIRPLKNKIKEEYNIAFFVSLSNKQAPSFNDLRYDIIYLLKKADLLWLGE